MSEESSGPAASPPVAAAPEVRVVVCTDSRPNRRSGRSKFEAPRTAHHEGDKTQGKRFEEKGSSARDAEDVSDDKANHHCGRRRINSVVQMEDGRDEGDKEDTDDQEGNDRFQQRVTTSGVNQDEADGEDLPFPGFAPKTFMFFTQRNWLRFSIQHQLAEAFRLAEKVFDLAPRQFELFLLLLLRERESAVCCNCFIVLPRSKKSGHHKLTEAVGMEKGKAKSLV
ncbi:hypothetical protein C0Q70_00259 [Pomacea canaliculata]|uniref:Uncharacterized protein n=1 Tax=Pomacea canaliculata TaxID=400727 RepID=A0A2T7PW84_POMCA|nr:hypothetical protein C0Q70_00259 [Pomacea canaliculata]